jgi:chromosome segregation ATPase
MSKTVQDRVAEAATKLVAQGRKVSLDAVRGEIGGGSLRDISPALRQWREQQQAAEAAVSLIPAEMTAVVERAAGLIWTEAERRAGEQVAAIRAKAAEHVAEVESERDDALNDIARLEGQLSESAKTLEATRADLSVANARAERAEALVDSGKTEASRLQAEIALSGKSVEKARENERLAREEAAELRGQVKALGEQLARAEKALEQERNNKSGRGN